MKGLILLSVFLLPLFVVASTPPPPSTSLGPLVICGDKDVSKDGVVDNPCGFNDIIKMAQGFINGWIMVGVTIGALGFAYAGYLYITAMGSGEKIQHAHSIFVKVVVGIVFMLSAWLIVKTLETAFLTPEQQEKSYLENN